MDDFFDFLWFITKALIAVALITPFLVLGMMASFKFIFVPLANLLGFV